jgi:hypothetical protein
MNYLLGGPDFEPDPPDFCLLSSKDYRHEPPALPLLYYLWKLRRQTYELIVSLLLPSKYELQSSNCSTARKKENFLTSGKNIHKALNETESHCPKHWEFQWSWKTLLSSPNQEFRWILREIMAIYRKPSRSTTMPGTNGACLSLSSNPSPTKNKQKTTTTFTHS